MLAYHVNEIHEGLHRTVHCVGNADWLNTVRYIIIYVDHCVRISVTASMKSLNSLCVSVCLSAMGHDA